MMQLIEDQMIRELKNKYFLNRILFRIPDLWCIHNAIDRRLNGVLVEEHWLNRILMRNFDLACSDDLVEKRQVDLWVTG